MKGNAWLLLAALIGLAAGWLVGELQDDLIARRAAAERQVVLTCQARGGYAVRGVDGTYGCAVLR